MMKPCIHPSDWLKNLQVFAAWVISSTFIAELKFRLFKLEFCVLCPPPFIHPTLLLSCPDPDTSCSFSFRLHAILHIRPLTSSSFMLSCGTIITRSFKRDSNKMLVGESWWKRPCLAGRLIEADNGTGLLCFFRCHHSLVESRVVFGWFVLQTLNSCSIRQEKRNVWVKI